MDYIKEGEKIISSKSGIIAAYGYGSSFFHQAGYNSKTIKSMDFIFVVDNLKEWFKVDIENSPDDYVDSVKKRLLKLSSKRLKGHTGIIYNVVRNKKIKYKFGVIEKNDFLNNLIEWKSFYVTGRLQKPVYVFKSDKELDAAIELNRKNALIASLLILNKEEVTTFELFETLCSLSYKGDIRFIIENPNKVANIVNGNMENLIDLYSKYEKYIDIKKDKVKVNLEKVYEEKIPLLDKVSKDKYSKTLLKHIKHINFKESIAQPLKGLKVSGLKDSLSYVKEKAKKKKLK